MSVTTCSATPIDAVMIEARPGGATADVWLRRNIEKDVADNGADAEKAIEFYRADELHFVAVGVPSVEEVTAAFDELWEAHEDDELTEREQIGKLIAQLKDTRAALEDTNAALLEIGDLVGGEQ
ncbi:hypothetical protein ET524_10570 [Senegalimassilia faecalis]|uniref:Uncharacterized protein n=1 Tax=Senegalimassilia faecalis TaxID=2509433 RepID=A0A4Q2K0D2_9ACTN|nr:hypothetical protein [Senegalimassilia faecalis]RXZ54875.1 hypothetical protein ET524_10570 [Senegalimassilia faecalis]